jgi:3-oxoacyl-[acyl-carrier protein] reductase
MDINRKSSPHEKGLLMGTYEQHALSGRVCLVTGGSSGIGAACCLLLAQAGAKVIVGYNNGHDRAAVVLATLPGQGHTLQRLSLTDTASHPEIAESIRQRYGQLNLLVNSAGFTKKVDHKDLDTLDPDLFSTVLQGNVVGTYSIIRSLLPLLATSDEALVVTISSIAGFTGGGSNMAYAASKAALDILSVSLAKAFGPQVRFLSISAGSVDTGFVANRTREQLQARASETPLGKIIKPQDIAESVFACATLFKAATGAKLVVDGGQCL